MTTRQLSIAQYITWAIVGCGGLCLLVAAFVARTAFFRSYWLAWIFWGGLSFGGFAIITMQSLVGGKWSRLLQRPAQAASRTLFTTGFLLLPVCWGMSEIFPWAKADYFEHHALPHHAMYLTPRWFWVRAGLYFGLLIPLGFFIRAYTRAAELRRAGMNQALLTGLGGVGACVYVVAMNFASTDWVMSLEPEWSSTIFSVIFMVSQFLSALALCALSALLLTPGRPAKEVLRDVGNLLLAFVVFWAYVSFSQFLIIWSANLPQEISWYVHRRSGAWPVVALLMGLAQFLLPFALLLSRANKHRPRVLVAIAGWIFCANALHVYWMIAPSYHPDIAAPHWLEILSFLTIGALWLAVYLRKLEAAYV